MNYKYPTYIALEVNAFWLKPLFSCLAISDNVLRILILVVIATRRL